MCTKRLPPVPERQFGLTLIELIVFIVVVGVALAGIAAAINYNVQHTVDPVVRKQALAIAESMLEEVLLQNFSDPDGGANVVEASRDLYDDVDDYNGYTRSGISSIEAPGTTIAGLEGYNVGIAVQNAAADINGVVASNIKVVTVTVTGPINTAVTLQGYRINYGG